MDIYRVIETNGNVGTNHQALCLTPPVHTIQLTINAYDSETNITLT